MVRESSRVSLQAPKTQLPREDSRPTIFVAEGRQARWYESPREYPSRPQKTQLPRGDSRPSIFVAEGRQARWSEAPDEECFSRAKPPALRTPSSSLAEALTNSYKWAKPTCMTTVSPDSKGRASLGKFLLPGETWAVEQTAPGRVVLTRLEIPARRPRRKLSEHLDRLRRAGFQLPPADVTPATGPEL